MKVVGTVDIFNRLAQSTGFGASSRLGKPCKGVLQVRNRADGKHILVLSTKKEIGAHEYDVRSIQLFRTQFVGDGFATIEISQPPMNIMLRNCKPEELRAFIDDLQKLRREKNKNVTCAESGGGVSPALRTENKDAEEETEKPGTLRKRVTMKRPRSPELSKTEASKIKKSLDKSDTVISVRNRANYPKEFPATIEQIMIRDIRLRKVDIRMLKLQWLHCLDLSGNFLKGVDELAKLSCCLKVLILAKNEIISLPDDIFKTRPFRTLVRVDLSQNKLRKIPSSLISLHSLTDVNLSGNQLQYLPYNWMDMKSLRALNISQNRLLFIPATILYLQLTVLDMSRNSELHTTNDLKADYLGYSSVPTLFETTCEVVMNMQRKKKLPSDEILPSVIQTYLQGGKYCIECGKIGLRYKIIRDPVIPSSVCNGSLSACSISPALVPCLVKKVICIACDNSLPRSRKSRVI